MKWTPMRTLLALIGLLLVIGCGSSEPTNPLAGPGAPAGPGGGPAAGPDGGPGGGPGSASDSAASTIAGELPPDADLFTSGPELRGTVVLGDESRGPISGAAVTEHGVAGAKSVVTAEDGVFQLTLSNQETPAVHVAVEGYVPTIQICTAASRLQFGGEFSIELFPREEEEALSLEEFGEAVDWSKGQLIVHLGDLAKPDGLKVALSAPGAKAWILGVDDLPLAGDTLVGDASREVVFTGVPPGSWELTVTPAVPPACQGPTTVPVAAGTYTLALFSCSEEDDPDAAPSVEQPSPEVPGGDPAPLPPADPSPETPEDAATDPQ